MEGLIIYKYEPFLRFIIKKKFSYIKIFLFFIFFLWGLQIVFTIIDGTFIKYDKEKKIFESIKSTLQIPQSEKTYYLTNYNVHINHNFMYSFLIIIGIAIMRKIPEVFNQLLKNKVLILRGISKKDFIHYLNILYNKKSFFYFPLIITIITVVYYAIQTTKVNRLLYLVFKVNHIAPYHHYIFLNGLMWYFGFQLFLRVMITIFVLKKVFTSDKYLIDVHPFHPDRCGGLKSIGDLSILIDSIIILMGLAFSLHLSVIIIFQKGSLLKQPINILTLVLYIIFVPLIFWSIIGVVHKEMKRKKKQLLSSLREEYYKTFERLGSSLKIDSIDEKSCSTLEKIDTFYKHVKKMSVWPFNIEISSVFFSTFFLPIIIPIVTEILIGIVK